MERAAELTDNERERKLFLDRAAQADEERIPTSWPGGQTKLAKTPAQTDGTQNGNTNDESRNGL